MHTTFGDLASKRTKNLKLENKKIEQLESIMDDLVKLHEMLAKLNIQSTEYNSIRHVLSKIKVGVFFIYFEIEK